MFLGHTTLRNIHDRAVSVNLSAIPEGGEQRGGGFWCLDRRGVSGARNADALGAEPPGHYVLHLGRPGIVVLAVADQLRQLLECGQLRRPVWTVEQVPGHLSEAKRAAEQRSLGQEVDDLGRSAVCLGLRLQLAVPDLVDHGCEQLDVIAGMFEETQQVTQRLGALAADGAWT